MILEEFENVPAVIEPTDRSLLSGGEICDTIILSFNGKILERVKQIDGVYEGGYLTNLNGKLPWYIYEKDGSKVAGYGSYWSSNGCWPLGRTQSKRI